MSFKRAGAKSISLSWLPTVFRQRNNNQPTSTLPPEILYEIFSYIQLPRRDPTLISVPPPDPFYSFALVCRSWYAPARNILYAHVVFPRIKSAFKFHNSLVHNPHLRALVKRIDLPGRIGRQCPEQLRILYARIVDLLGNLEALGATVYSNEQWLSIYMPINNQQRSAPTQNGFPIQVPDLKSLTLYAEINGGEIRCKAPPLMTKYAHLETLELKGITEFEVLSPSTTPVLQNLKAFIATPGSIVQSMDEWLVACPKLVKLHLFDTTNPREPASYSEPPFAILRSGKIKDFGWCTMRWREALYSFPPWFTHKSLTRSLRQLQVYDSMFCWYTDVLPVDIIRLSIVLSPTASILFRSLTTYFSRGMTIKTLEMIACRHNVWLEGNRASLIAWLDQIGVELETFQQVCDCEPISIPENSQLLPAVKRAWSKALRPLEREIIEYEWPELS